MSLYYDILRAAYDRLSTAPGLPWPVVLRPDPVFYRDSDPLPVLIVSPRRDSQESVRELTMQDNPGAGQALIDHPVTVAFVYRNTKDQAAVRLEMDAREAVRQRLWVPVEPAYDVEYEPRPRGSVAGIGESIDATSQEFTYRAAAPRVT